MLSRWNPDKHLRIRSARLKLALRMIWYSMVVSSVGGFLFSLAFLLGFPNSRAENVMQAFVLAIFFGGGTALWQRLFASILLGVAMAIVAGKLFKSVKDPWVFKFAMGLTAASIVHLFAPIKLVEFYLTELTAGDYDTRWATATAIAVYAGAIVLSQVMAGKYMRETAT